MENTNVENTYIETTTETNDNENSDVVTMSTEDFNKKIQS